MTCTSSYVAKQQIYTILLILYSPLNSFVSLLADCQHLVITPIGEQIKTAGSGVIFTCTVTEYNRWEVPPIIHWRGPDHDHIVATKGRWVGYEKYMQFYVYIAWYHYRLRYIHWLACMIIFKDPVTANWYEPHVECSSWCNKAWHSMISMSSSVTHCH